MKEIEQLWGAGDFCDFVEEGTSGARGTPPPLLV